MIPPPSPPHVQELDLAAAIRSALDFAQPTLERAGLRLVVEVPDVLPARANPDHLAQVLANLLSNAARYTPTGGTVTVRAERRAIGSSRVDRERRRGHPAQGPRPRLRALLPRRSRATGRGVARGSGWPSSSSSSSRAADGSAPSRAAARPASGSACRVEPSSGRHTTGSSGDPCYHPNRSPVRGCGATIRGDVAQLEEHRVRIAGSGVRVPSSPPRPPRQPIQCRWAERGSAAGSR